MSERFGEMNEAEVAKSELIEMANNLEKYIEENSYLNMEFMKFEAEERMSQVMNEYEKISAEAKRLEDDYNSDERIKSIEKEVKWYQDRVNTLLETKKNNEKTISKYKSLVAQCQKGNSVEQLHLKSIKGEVLKLSQMLPKHSSVSPAKHSKKKSRHPQNSYFFQLTPSEKEQYDYLKSAAKRLKKTLQSVKNEIIKYRSEEFTSRQQVLPLEEFFNDCYKSVYHLIFQRQSELNNVQLSLAYNMFRERKMEYSEIKHRSHINATRCENYIVRDALQSKAKSDVKKNVFFYVDFK